MSVEITSRTNRNPFILGLIAFSLTSIPAHAAHATCDSPIPLTAGETWRDPGSRAGAGSCFSVRLDAAGVLALDIAAPADAPRPRLTFLSPQRTLQQSATSLILAADAGSYRLRVESEDPRQPLPPFRLSTRFVADRRAAAGIDKSEDDSELEIEPDPFTAGPLAACGSKSEDDSELEIEPDPVLAGPLSVTRPHDLAEVTALLSPRLCELCRPDDADDHGDAFLCATPLAWREKTGGEIGNGQGDDGDVFRFRLDSLTTVKLRARGAAELTAMLYDGHGQRLGTVEDDGTGMRLVRTLVAGTYFVRLEGRDGAAGRYSLSVGPVRGR